MLFFLFLFFFLVVAVVVDAVDVVVVVVVVVFVAVVFAFVAVVVDDVDVVWPTSVPAFAKHSLNSTQLQLKLSLRLALFPAGPATQQPGHPPNRQPTQPEQ